MTTNLYRAIKIRMRASSIKEFALNYYESTLSNCAKITAVNHSLCFIVYRKGVFGGPVIRTVDYPHEVTLSEFDNFVVVKDGFVYKLIRK